jgi:hypothetical protein
MAVLGEAHVIVKAITTGFEKSIKDAADRAGVQAGAAGENVSKAFNKSMDKMDANKAIAASKAWTALMRVGFLLQGAIGALVGSVATLVGGLEGIIAVTGQAATAGLVLVNVFASMKIASMVAKSALGGVMEAVRSATGAQGGMTKSLKETREELQQLRFDAEDAALGEKRAAIALEKARNSLARVQDLPPNSMARREALLSYQEAELAYRRAKDKNADLKDELENPEDYKKDKAGKDPFANLTPSQKEFAKYLVTIQDRMKDLKEAAASGFLPLLRTQIERILNGGLFDRIVAGYKAVGIGLGEATRNLTDKLLSPRVQENITKFFDQIARYLPTIGTVLGSVFSSFLTVMIALDPLTQRFLAWLKDASGRMDDFFAARTASGALQETFKRAGDSAAALSTIIRDMLGGFRARMSAATGPGSGGEMLLKWMADASSKFKAINKEASKQAYLKGYYKGAATNFIAMSQGLNKILDAFRGLGAEPATKELWEILGSMAPTIRDMLKDAIAVGPSLAKVVKYFLEMVEALTDAGQATAFFETLALHLRGVATALKAIMNNPVANFLGTLLGIASAFGLLILVVDKAKLIFMGFQIRLTLMSLSMRKIPLESAAGAAALKKLGITAEVAGMQMKKSFMGNPAMLAFLVAMEIAMLAISIHAGNMEKAQKGVTAAMKNGANAADLWKQAILAIPDGWAKDNAADFSELGKNLDHLNLVQQNFGTTLLFAGTYSTGLADSLGAMGKSLTELASEDLPAAQKAFKRFGDQARLNDTQRITALDEMDEYTAALKEQALMMGIDLYDATGKNIDKQKLLAFAVGEGEVAMLRAEAAITEFNKGIVESGNSIIDFAAAVDKSMNENELNVGKLIKTMQTQIADAAALQTNLLKLRARGLTDAMITQITNLGPKAGAAAAALVKASQEELDELILVGANAAFQTGEAMVAAFDKAQPLLDAATGKISKSAITAFLTQLSGAKSQPEIDRAIAAFQAKLTSAGIKIPITPEVKSLTPAQVQMLMKPISLNDPAVKKLLNQPQKNGGLIGKAATGFANGGLIGKAATGFASGGLVLGPGGPRSDRIPTMLSNGEFVVNAASTEKNLGLLRAINGDSNAANGVGNTITVNVHPSPGMDEQALAAVVSRQLAFEMRRGGF